MGWKGNSGWAKAGQLERIRPSEEVAWVAGIFEGEGSAGMWSTGSKRGQKAPQLSITNTQKDMLDEVVRIIGFGRVSPPYFPKKPNCNPIYKVSYSARKALYVAHLLLPFIKSNYKRNQLESLLKVEKKV